MIRQSDKPQLHVRVNPDTRALLEKVSREHGASHGDIVESVLQAFLMPPDEAEKLTGVLQRLGLIEAQLSTIETKVVAVETVVSQIVTLLEKLVSSKDGQHASDAIPIATFAPLYPDEGQEEEQVQFEPPPSLEAPQAPPPSRRSLLGRLLLKGDAS